MDIRSVIHSQFHAALDMLDAAIEACPDDVWDRPELPWVGMSSPADES